MRHFFISVLLLTIVALSSSNVLPMSANELNQEQLSFDSQHNDNTFRNRYQARNVYDQIYDMYLEPENRPVTTNKLQVKYADMDNNQNYDTFNILNKNDNYNGEGFRKEQWHNYPRQLDRLHQFYQRDTEKRFFGPNPDNERYTEEIAPDNQDINDITNEFHLDTKAAPNNDYSALEAATNPLLILKMRLACLNRGADSANGQYTNLVISGLEPNHVRGTGNYEEFKNDNPELTVIKVKREGASTQNNESTDNLTQSKVVNKRIFSLWSRLQSLNHKGHELQHRRHFHAFYGLPDSSGGGILTAETRATLMRPPGSPLRWG